MVTRRSGRLALEPKWRLAPWHTTPVDGKTEIGGARNLDTLRTRLAGCMVRRVRAEVLSQLPARTDTRVPIEMTAEQMEEHSALDMPIAQLLGRARRRPLTQAEFLRLMMLLTTQRIIANGLAQLRFEEMWPDLSRIERPTESTLRGLASPKLLELRELIGQLALAQARKVVVFSQWRRMLRLAHWATRDELARERVRAAFFTGEEGQKRRTQNIVDFHDDPACRVLFATDAGGVGLNLQRAASACIKSSCPGTRRCSSSGSGGSTDWVSGARSTSTTSSANPESSHGSPISSSPSGRSSPGCSTGRPTRWPSSGRGASSPGSSAS